MPIAPINPDAAPANQPRQEPPTQSELLLKTAEELIDERFHDSHGRGYVNVFVPNPNIDGNHIEVWPVLSKGFRGLLESELYRQFGLAASKAALDSAVSTIDATARFDGEERQVYVRVARVTNEIWLDLCDERWRAVHVTSQGWQIEDYPTASAVHFIRGTSSRPFPEPVKNGSVAELRPFLNLRSRNDWVLVASYLVGALRGAGPYAVLNLRGGEGTAKTTHTEILSKLIDPCQPSHRTAPKGVRDLMIAAQWSHLIALDNVSHIEPWLSDALCRLCTGAGYGTRKNYTDDEEQLFEAERPIIINGIGDLITKSDLADRTVTITLEPIPEEKRQTESKFWQSFEKAYPRILGGLLDALSAALANEDKVNLEKLPRMADFAVWATAAEQALGFKPGEFMAAYRESQSKAEDAVIESLPAVEAVIDFMQSREEWSGTHTELLEQIGGGLVGGAANGPDWPKTPKALSTQLTRGERLLRTRRIVREEMQRKPGTGERPFRLRQMPTNPASAPAEAASAPTELEEVA